MNNSATLIYTLSNMQARQFMLAKHGLIGKHKFSGKQGIMDFVKQAGCVQFDPIDVCGKNYELAIHHKVGTIKHYELVENCIDKDILSEKSPFENDEQKYKWWVYRRICSVGLLPNKASDAWLNIGGLKAPQRNPHLNSLCQIKSYYK